MPVSQSNTDASVKPSANRRYCQVLWMGGERIRGLQTAFSISPSKLNTFDDLGDELGALESAPVFLASVANLNTMVSVAIREPQPFV